MRTTRAFALFSLLVVTAIAPIGPLGATTTVVQHCNGPLTSAQAGSATFSPGINALATKQKISIKIRLTSCSPAGITKGSGSFKSGFTTPYAATCAIFNAPHVLTTTAVITWANTQTSTIKLTFSLTGATRYLNVAGTVSGGLMKGHALTAQYRYRPVPSRSNNTVAEACANKVAPATAGRESIASLSLFRTKVLVIS